jgi:DNA-binding NarL/FixJ family response regulator
VSLQPAGTGGGDEPIAVALLINDTHLRRRVARVIRQSAARMMVAGDDSEADIVVADYLADTALPVVVIGDAAMVEAALRHGCAGAIGPDCSDAQLRIVVEAAAHGLVCTDRSPAVSAASSAIEDDFFVSAEFTAREIEVLQLLITGASNKDIARRLAISVHTAKFHVAAIIGKLGASGRTDAVARALRLGRTMI